MKSALRFSFYYIVLNALFGQYTEYMNMYGRSEVKLCKLRWWQ